MNVELSLVPPELGHLCRCARTELITLDLICPSTYQLLRNSRGDSGTDLSFDKSASPERLFLPFLDDLNDLIIKYKILRDLHPRLPSKDFVMSELPDDAIGIYHQMFDFSGVRIPFSSFPLALIKHYRVHFSQLGPLGFNKVIPDAMVWRHPNAAIYDPRPAAGSLTWQMCDTSAEVQEEPYLDVSLLMGDDDESDDDDDACVEIPLVTPLRSAVVIPSSGNQGRSSVASTVEGSNT
ncbi:hypothetical protein Tco_1252020 [Tanacetum coccineum]